MNAVHLGEGFQQNSLSNAFTRQYKLVKTIRFELKPVGRTLETFKERFLASDRLRAETYPGVKKLLDSQHKSLLERALSNPPDNLDWNKLAQAHSIYAASDRSREEKDKLAAMQAEFRKTIACCFQADPSFSLLTAPTPKTLFVALQEACEQEQQPVPDEVKTFIRFSRYFTGYQENRRNIYSPEAQATSAANRAVNVNFPKFLEDIRIYRHIAEYYPAILSAAENELSPLLHGESAKRFVPEGLLASIFEPCAYRRFLAQSGIDFFNQILGGFLTEDGRKVRGINEFINLYRHQHEEVCQDRMLAFLRPLYKQILSDRETLSFGLGPFSDDAELVMTLRNAIGQRLLGLETEMGCINVLDSLQALLKTLSADSAVWIDGTEIQHISKELLGGWKTLDSLMESEAEVRFASEISERKREDSIARWMKRTAFSISELSNLRLETDEGTVEVDVSKLWIGSLAKRKFDAARAALNALWTDLESEFAPDIPLRERKELVAHIKAALDTVLDILHFIKPLHAGVELVRDETFYGEFDRLYAVLASFVPLYNRVRNHLTRKPCETERIKLMFDNPTLANGRDLNKEKDNTCVLFIRDGLYYLGIMNPEEKTTFSKLAMAESAGCYRKMVYKLLPGPNKMLPKVFFSQKGKKLFHPSESLLACYKAGKYKKGANFDLQFCRKLIDFFKASIAIHPDWRQFGFRFSPTESYQSIDEFYREVSEQGYRVSFENIPPEIVDRLVEEGKLCLFLLWNKDFSVASTGRSNLHTRYWKALFSPENLQDVVVKLNGEAELFFRPRTIKTPFRHKVGEKMVNRRAVDGSPIPDSIHGELNRHFNGGPEPLSEEAARWMESSQIIVKDVKHEIVKDRRFSEDKFAFHVPITLNFKAPDIATRFNDKVRDCLRSNPNVNVIGIDRGERNLLYLVLVDRQGNLLEQRSFNTVLQMRQDGTVIGTDYQAKLAQTEKDRDVARKTWSEIGGIRDLKTGYLSAVVHEIARLMVERNAIVVLEDLNTGFKRGRFRIERQVYQKFEKALIDKLNYLVFKDRVATAVGGTLRGYQLTEKFTSFERIGKQTGFLFYVPAAYTSKIDPTTGFTNLFNTKKCINARGIRDFFLAFDSIQWNAERHAFAFAFDYKNFRTSQESHRTAWTVYSAHRRLVFDKKAHTEREIDPTALLLGTVETHGAVVTDGFDLKALLESVEPVKANAAFFQTIFYAFDRTLQMRNSRDGEDYIQSPVLNARGEFFDSRKADASLPRDADANGAYHIALKGLLLLEENLVQETPDLQLEHRVWFRFAQTLAARKFK